MAQPPFVLTQPLDSLDFDAFFCVFPIEEEEPPERLDVCDPRGLRLYARIRQYSMNVRFQNEFPSERLLEMARCHGLPMDMIRQGSALMHAVILKPHARTVVMNVQSETQLERHLNLMKQHLLCGTFDDDEESRYCCWVMTTMQCHFPPNYRLDTARLCAEFEQGEEWDADLEIYCLKYSFATLRSVAGAATAQNEMEVHTVTWSGIPGEYEYPNLGCVHGEDDCDEDEKIVIGLISSHQFLLHVPGDRVQLQRVQSLLLCIFSRYLSAC